MGFNDRIPLNVKSQGTEKIEFYFQGISGSQNLR